MDLIAANNDEENNILINIINHYKSTTIFIKWHKPNNNQIKTHRYRNHP